MTASGEPPVLQPPTSVGPAWAAAIAAGALGWILTMVLGDRQEAWDSPYYFKATYPMFALTAVALGYLHPVRPWRWALGIALGQAAVAFVRNPTANLLPLGLIMFALYSAPLILAAMAGTRFRRWRDDRKGI